MPYITCNGAIKSRYDTSIEVKKCIADERSTNTAIYNKCTETTKCLADREFKANGMVGFLVVLVLAFILVGIWVAFKKVND